MKNAAIGAVLIALVAPGIARAEPIPGTGAFGDAALAIAPDASPRVAAIVDGRLLLTAREAAGWTAEAAPALPGPRALVVGAAVSPGGLTYVLVEQESGGWLVLAERAAEGWRLRVLVRRVAKNAALGIAGLALDRSGRPVVAYALLTSSRKTWLRIVRPDARGRLMTRAITKGGFPPSRSVPSAAPVILPGGGVRVVETYESAAIEWAPRGRTWEGQFLFASPLGAPAGPVGVAAGPGGIWSAWTELYPSFGESHVLLTLHRDGERTTVLATHAYLVSLALSPAGPEVAANDYAGTAEAGLVLAPDGTSVELAAKLLGYAVDPTGARQVLLRGTDGLEWYRSPSTPSVQVTLVATPAAGAVALRGTVAGASGGSVELYREPVGQIPALAASVPLAADGSFAASDSPPVSPLLYRAVYRAPDGLPYGSLLRQPVASG